MSGHRILFIAFFTVALVVLFHCCSCYVRFSIFLCISGFDKHPLQTHNLSLLYLSRDRAKRRVPMKTVLKLWVIPKWVEFDELRSYKNLKKNTIRGVKRKIK